jgi:hypothetical protein
MFFKYELFEVDASGNELGTRPHLGRATCDLRFRANEARQGMKASAKTNFCSLASTSLIHSLPPAAFTLDW